MIDRDTRFRPVFGTEESISKTEKSKNPGYLYFAEDTGKMYLDISKTKRISVGGSGSGASLLFSQVSAVTKTNNNNYIIPINSILNDSALCAIGDLIINSDGTFYKVESLDKINLYCSMVSTSTGAVVWYIESDEEILMEEDNYFHIPVDSIISNNNLCQEDDLIIDKIHNTFYRVDDIDKGEYLCYMMAGGGGSSASTNKPGQLKVELANEPNILNGSDCIFNVTVISGTEDGEPIDAYENMLKVTINYFEGSGDNMSSIPYFTETKTATHEVTFPYNAKEHLRESKVVTLVFSAEGSNQENRIKFTPKISITSTNLVLNWSDNKFSNSSYFDPDDIAKALTVQATGTTGIGRIYDIYFDDFLVYTEKLSGSEDVSSYTITENSKVYDKETGDIIDTLGDKFSHGSHTIKAQLSLQTSLGKRGSSTNLITREIGLKTMNKPLIWVNDLKDSYYEYETVFVEFRVYDPNSTNGSSSVYLYKDGVNALGDGYRTVSNTAVNWEKWELSNFSVNNTSTYTIRVGDGENEVKRNIVLNIVADPRDMANKAPAAKAAAFFSAKGRANTDSNRETLLFNGQKAIFKDFNWYNNGWVTEGKMTSLKVSNGAEVKIPMGIMTFGASYNRTIEIRMKISNVQDYGTLITNYTRYKYTKDGQNWNDSELFEKFKEQRNIDGGYTNYDAYLTKQIPIEQAKEGAGFIPSYDDLEFDKLDKDYNLENAVITYMSSTNTSLTEPAICFGPQDGFFSNGTNSVTVNFVEDEIINVTIVSAGGETMNGNDNLMKIYLNGMLTSVARSTISKSGSEKLSWSIGSDNDSYFTIKSNSCDIDIYSIRTYATALNTVEVLKDYAYDNSDTKEWDLADLFDTENGTQRFSYKKMLDYNTTHLSEPLMPYIVFTTDDTNPQSRTKGNLPWYKSNSDGSSHSEKIDMEFVNVPLDAANSLGLLTAAAQEEKYTDTIDKNGNVTMTAEEDFYLHHCPSWKGKNIDLSVQGTSSEFYPRRNYKAKTKVDVPDYEEDGITQKTEVHKMYNELNELIDEYTEYKVADEYEMIPHRGPFKTEYEAYEADKEGKIDPRRLEFFYYDNNNVGTNKFTLKIDFMESSGSYNMGLANLVNNAYSHHPIHDYLAHESFVNEKVTKGVEIEETVYDPAKAEAYSYITHKGEWKTANADNKNLKGPVTEEMFAKGPMGCAGEEKTINEKTLENAIGESGLTEEYLMSHVNKWYTYTPGSVDYSKASIEGLENYRTTVQGFPVLAFHQTKSRASKNADPVFIGRYNMLLDKGSDEVFGFKLSKKILQGNIEGHPTVREAAECWEFENNSRGWCSFRDPWNRRELSFEAPAGTPDTAAYTSNLAPIVADSFEYRYNTNKDYIDLLVTLKQSAESSKSRIQLHEKFGIDIADSTNGLKEGRKKLLDLYKNWERAVQWVWTTATDASIDFGTGELLTVPALGVYEDINLATKFEENKYYIYTPEEKIDSNGNIYILDKYTIIPTTEDFLEILLDDATHGKETYFYRKSIDNSSGTPRDIYPSVKLILEETEDVKLYEAGKYYTKVNNNYVLCEDSEINELAHYYKLIQDYSEVELQEADYEAGKYFVIKEGQYRRAEEEYNSEETYYESHLNPVWKLDAEKKYGSTYYNFDTKEYRLAKFKAELQQHFNFEYLITYFTITEVLECYDSRGKNCMMASWGPQNPGGDYIWYPIFYDMDTQLGINNTGIPSFEYNIDATEEGTFSTNDSVLWNNLYSLYKNSISLKYQQLKGLAANDFSGPYTDSSGILKNAPFASINKIEQFYSCDPALYQSYYSKGDRPLLAFNCDEEYKYIAITNNDAAGNSHTGSGENAMGKPPVYEGYLSSDKNAPKWQNDSSNSFFYALQGSRSMSRRQFLTNRFNYLDSWLNVGSYERAGGNRIRSRISANNSRFTSDNWITGTAQNGDTDLLTNQQYWLTADENPASGKKAHLFDGEYWIKMTPARSMYVTVGTDAANFPSVKYSGTPVYFQTDDLKNGVMSSGNYREQLYYVYGLDQMKSLGDLSKLYFQEFALEGSVSKLTDLKLGYDGLDEEGNAYKNQNVNDWTIPGSIEDSNGGMPLLKEMNLSNITFVNKNKTINLTSCNKLRNFRATGSNITEVTFAEGVSLDTLYLPETVTSLALTEARMLKDFISVYKVPELNEDGNLVADKGLYVKGLTDASTEVTKITSVNIKGGSLGYNSYLLLSNYYNYTFGLGSTNNRKLALTDVQWSPYELVGSDASYDNTKTYKVDNGHFGLRDFVEGDVPNWAILTANGAIYELVGDEAKKVTIKDIKLLNDVYNKFKGVVTDKPNITGVIYVDNEVEIDEGEIQTGIQAKYPGVTFFFNKVKTGYAARFVIPNEDGSEKLIGTDKLSSDAFANRLFFKNPILRTENEFKGSVMDATNPIKDFLGWGTREKVNGEYVYTLIETYDVNGTQLNGEKPIHKWNTLSLEQNTFDYTYYAVFDYHYYDIYWASEEDVSKEQMHLTKTRYGTGIIPPTDWVPGKDDTGLMIDIDGEMVDATYKPKGWYSNIKTKKLVDTTAIIADGTQESYTFYAAYDEVSVYDNVLGEEALIFTFESNYGDNKGYEEITYDPDYSRPKNYGYYIRFKEVELSGKITLPVEYNGKPILGIINNSASNYTYKPQTKVTEVFFAKSDNLEMVRFDGDEIFSNWTELRKFHYPETLRVLRCSFKGCSKLEIPDFSNLQNLKIIGDTIFNGTTLCSYNTTTLYIPGSVTLCQGSCFFNVRGLSRPIANLQFGDETHPCSIKRITDIGDNAFYLRNNNDFINVYVYYDEQNPTPLIDENVVNVETTRIVWTGEYHTINANSGKHTDKYHKTEEI